MPNSLSWDLETIALRKYIWRDLPLPGQQYTSMMIDFLIGFLFITTLYLYVARLVRWRKNTLPLPPGPKRLPLVGNLFIIPRTLQWETYHKWSRELSESQKWEGWRITGLNTMNLIRYRRAAYWCCRHKYDRYRLVSCSNGLVGEEVFDLFRPVGVVFECRKGRPLQKLSLLLDLNYPWLMT